MLNTLFRAHVNVAVSLCNGEMFATCYEDKNIKAGRIHHSRSIFRTVFAWVTTMPGFQWFDIGPTVPTPSQKRSSRPMARAVKGLHSFLCHSCVYPGMERTLSVFVFAAKWGNYVRPRTDGRLSWLSLLGTTVVTRPKQSAGNRHVTAIASVSCSNRHPSRRSWNAKTISVELTASRTANHDANHHDTERLVYITLH